MNDIAPLDDGLILELLGSPKYISAPPKKKEKQNGKHTENGFEMKTEDGEHSFTVFIRQNSDLPENFSVGCIWHRSDEKSILLTRYNGDHGAHINFDTNEVIEGFHIHGFSVDFHEQGLNPLHRAISTEKYGSLNEALYCFFQDLNVTNFQEHFPDVRQSRLF